MALMTLQYFFDRGDMKKAAQVIYNYKPDPLKETTLISLMAEKYNLDSQSIRCETELISRYEGSIFIDCGVTNNFTKHSDENFHWLVDVVSARIVAKNDKARELMNEVNYGK